MIQNPGTASPDDRYIGIRKSQGAHTEKSCGYHKTIVAKPFTCIKKNFHLKEFPVQNQL